MCGIALVSGEPSDKGIHRMAEAIRHRGPDALVIRRLPGCTLAHARLSIIDLVSGDQPMQDETGRWWIALNGEIYNYRELRSRLIAEGVSFRTNSDTEVLLEAWKAWGRRTLDLVRGMFAFAIWDGESRTLFAARDLFGEKPLYYALADSGQMVLASEMKAILASGLLQPRLSRDSVDAFLMLGYVPPDRTIYENVHVIPPAHLLEWRCGRPSPERYWQPGLMPQEIGIEDAASELLHLMDRAVERQMIADVPVGAFLSGGLDSSTVVALMSRHTSKPVKTFSVAFGSEINELPFAREVAARYGTEHHEIDLGVPDLGSLVERMVEVYDEPFADTSHIPTYRICEFARGSVKVVLTGDGGDELLGGYWWYPPLAESETWRLGYASWAVLRLASILKRHRDPGLKRRSVGAGLAARWNDVWERDVALQTVLNARRRRRLWGSDVPRFDPVESFRPDASVSGLERAIFFDVNCYLPGDILVKVDRAAMAHGLETRAPFLDRDLAEFAFSLPSSLKVKENETRIIARRAFSDLWPPVLRTRGKQGFGAPVGSWLQTMEVTEMIARVLSSASPLRSLLPGLRNDDLSRGDYSSWVLLTLGLWLERHEGALT